MTRPRRLMAMPTSALKVDGDLSPESPKGYSENDLQEIAATVPAVYDRIAAGWHPSEFAAARWSTDSRDQQLGETYCHLFQNLTASASLRADFDGRDLVVDKGNHRIVAARNIAVPVLPVWVTAHTEAGLDQIEQVCAQRIDREGATPYRQAHELNDRNSQLARTTPRERAGDQEGREREALGPEIWCR
jgi:hypothetical protein